MRKMVGILKIGGSVLTDKTKLESPRMEAIERIAAEVASYSSGLVLVHGAGSFGHIHADKYDLRERFDPEGILETHRSVVRLNEIVVEALGRAGAHPVPVHPLSCALLQDGRIRDMNIGPLTEMIERGLLPVLHGDVVMDRLRGADILSGDQIVTHLARSLGADVVALGTREDGVIYDGEVVSRVTRENYHRIEPELGGSKGVDDVTGGMRKKVMELLDLADDGIPSLIFNAGKKGMIEKALGGELVGTLVDGSS